MELSLAKGNHHSRKPMRLKDYLVDELSSCSSNGFRSYPRRQRQCCTNIPLIVQLDLKNMPPKCMKKPTLKSPSKSSLSSISSFQRASNALINAVVRHLPFASSASTLPRKLIKRCFSKKTVEIPIGINAVDQKSSSPELSFTGSISSSSLSAESNGESYSWSGSDFTASDHEYLPCSRVNCEVKKLNKKPKARSVKNNGIVYYEDSVEEATSDTSSSSSISKPRPLRIEEEKEQFSPVSVLERPFEDDEDEDEVSSPCQPRLARSKGSRKRLVKKSKKSEGITKVEPISLEKCIALSESDDQESTASPLYASPQSISEEPIECKAGEEEEDENNAEKKALELLQLMRGTMPSSPVITVELEKLLLEFFREGIEIGLRTSPMGLTRGVNAFDNELLNTAVDWMKGKGPHELVQKTDVKKNMEECLHDIEKDATWRKWDEEKNEFVLELEAEVFASLLNEVLHDHYFFP